MEPILLDIVLLNFVQSFKKSGTGCKLKKSIIHISHERICAVAGDLGEAKELLTAVVQLYHNERPHMSIGNPSPNHVHHII